MPVLFGNFACFSWFTLSGRTSSLYSDFWLYWRFVKSFFFNWDSLHSQLNSHYEAWSFEKRSIKILNSCEGKEYVKEKVEIYTYFLRPEPFSRFSMRVVLNFLNPYDFWPRLLELPFPSVLKVLQKAYIHTPHLYLN